MYMCECLCVCVRACINTQYVQIVLMMLVYCIFVYEEVNKSLCLYLELFNL